MMRHGSLFSGIGGFDLASEWMGWENVFHCEWNEFGKKVLHHYWPNAESFDDITKTDFTKYANKIDILTGGFPCQPYSMAGKRQGKEDERHLWPQMLRAIREIKPKYIVGENVFGLLNWNGGMVFDEVHSDLELEGYEVQAVVIPAAAVNAPHGRDRIWFVATNTQFKSEGSDGGTNDETEGNIRRGNEGDVFGTLRSDGNATNSKSSGSPIGKLGESETKQQVQTRRDIDGFESLGVIADTHGIGNWGKSKQSPAAHKQGRGGKTNTGIGNEGEQQFVRDITGEGVDSNTDSVRLQHTEETRNIQESTRTTQSEGGELTEPVETNGGNGNVADTTSPGGRKDNGIGKSRFNDQTSASNGWDNFPTQSPICGGDDGLPTELDGITFSKWRNESIKAYGNAIVPQVAYQIFKAIQETI
jgi:DNA (cytosine-5)-methyltransferase 1